MRSNGKAPLCLQELEVIRRQDSKLIVYEAVVEGNVFAYLYSNPSSYSLVWRAPAGFRFDNQLPYGFIEFQFSYLAPSRLSFFDLTLPKPRPHSSSITKFPHNFFYDRANATVVSSESDDGYVEYDLLDSEADRQEYSKKVKQPETASQIRFARYDSLVVKNTQHYDCCVTFESPRGAATDNWEFAVKLPRDVRLSERALVWIVRHHQLEALKHQIDFKQVLNALSETLDQRPAPVLYGELS